MQKAGPNGNGIAGLATSHRVTPFLAAAGPNGYGGDASIRLTTLQHDIFALIPFWIVYLSKIRGTIQGTVGTSTFLAVPREMKLQICGAAGPNG